jgi:hypothetical protein
MNAVLDQVTSALAPLVTATGKPKSGGEWARVLDEAAALAGREAHLRRQVEALGGDLRRRSQVLRDQAGLSDPAVLHARATALNEAKAAHQAALAHAALQLEAAREAALANLTTDKTTREITRLERLAERARTATEAHAKASERATIDRTQAETLSAKDRAADEAILRAAQLTRTLRLRLAVAQKARLATAARQRAADLARSLERAEALQRQQSEAKAQRSLIKVTPQSLAAADKAQVAVDRLTAQSDAQAVTLKFTYTGPARALRHGNPVPDAPHRLDGPVDFDLPGIGVLRVDPGADPGSDLPARMTQSAAALTHQLTLCGAADLPAAQRDLRAAQRLDDTLRSAGDAMAAIAPDGVAGLRDALAHAQAEAGEATDTAEAPAAEYLTAIEPLLQAAEAAESETRAVAATAHALATAAGEQRAKSEADLKSAGRALAEATEEAGDPAGLEIALSDLRALLATQRSHARDATAEAGRLQSLAPDPATAAARLARATSAADQARQQADGLREELASLNTRIEVLAEQGIEETLNEVAAEGAAASARARRYETEVQALTRLRGALEDARAQARDAYFGPVLQELTPLLAILHPGADLQIDDKTLLPATLTRAGQPEPLDILSGGTREQLAILTRLAFARLFAKAGQQVPVILDDALVHSDDDRIEAMFVALHRVAADQQILVLTCRQRAFAALGGDRAKVVVTAL